MDGTETYNKSNSMAAAGRVEANLPGTSAACAIFNNKCITRKYLSLKMQVKVIEYNIHHGAI